jgi:hypothetical protein
MGAPLQINAANVAVALQLGTCWPTNEHVPPQVQPVSSRQQSAPGKLA